MPYCQECGTETLASTAFCRQCGKSVDATAPSAAAAVASDAKLSTSWIHKFAMVEKAGGLKMQNQKDLTVGERMAVIFNIWGFLFGPFYYLVKGMWRKAIMLTVLGLTAAFLLQVVLEMLHMNGEALTRFVCPAIFACRATIDYYKKVVLKDNAWW